MRPTLLVVAALLAPAFALAHDGPHHPGVRGDIPMLPFPSGEVTTLNIVEWDSNQLPRIYERSDQLPLTDEELVKLSGAGFAPAQIVKMIEERRCACDASADGLIQLKRGGVAPEVLAAVSRHALAPNRFLDLLVTLDFEGTRVAASGAPGADGQGIPREGFLYFFIDDGDLTRVLSTNIGELLRRRFTHETMVDRSDLLLVKQVRRVELPGRIPLKSYGRHTVMVVPSARPTITHPSQLTAQERSRAQVFTFTYPRSSLQSLCRVQAAWKRDPVLAHRFGFVGSRFECEWN